MKNRIKKIIRKNLPETNSSSSHSVAICMNNGLIKEGDPEFDLDIRDGVLYIPNHDEFGWEYFKSNSVLEKLQYVCGIYCYDPDSASGQKQIKKLKNFLCKYLGVKDVVFEWIVDYAEKKKLAEERKKSLPIENSEDDEDEEDDFDVYYDYPEINHNSHDIFEEITESEDTLKNFIFNPNSWLYGGNDNSEPPRGFYIETEIENTEEPDAIVSVYFPDDLGRVDFEVANFPCEHIFREISIMDDDNMLKNIVYDTKTKKVSVLTREDLFHGKKYSKDETLLFFTDEAPYVKNGKEYVIYANNKFSDSLINEFNIIRANEELICPILITQKIIESGIVKNGVDYVMFPMEIKYTKLGITI